jgi:hypothetical protein
MGIPSTPHIAKKSMLAKILRISATEIVTNGERTEPSFSHKYFASALIFAFAS